LEDATDAAAADEAKAEGGGKPLDEQRRIAEVLWAAETTFRKVQASNGFVQE